MASGIPPEIMTDIMYRLPSKSIGRFRSVSKGFLSLLSQPQFIIKIKEDIPNCKHFILVSDHDSLYSLRFNHHRAVPRPIGLCLKLPYVDVFTFHGSCNGLALVSAEEYVPDLTLIVLNPMTREYVKLPDSRYGILDDWRKTDFVFGFGYDSVNDDYKVVVVSLFRNDYYVHVYSLKTNSWRRVSYNPYDHAYGKDSTCVFVNGFLYWFAVQDFGDLGVIVAFSLAGETLGELPLPSSLNDANIMAKNELKLVAVHDKLAIFMKGEVWLMNDSGIMIYWTKILLLGLHKMAMGQPLVFCDDGKFLVVSGYELSIYDSKDGKHINTFRDIDYLYVRGFFVESHASPKFKRSYLKPTKLRC